ncbi:BREX-3 system P-loop-containing protein BrxF [Acinetobacter sp. YH12105]|uniref:BREX-3 system P-loop-containing protein BrxF n=1 Tax=Acinetobacter sp. YH12105 TaxID=2601093 RepID=UPI0015D3F616|nr:BREX-3 system P-loop-containing protein BrxF [Acinetobacter sp. YH12105]
MEIIKALSSLHNKRERLALLINYETYISTENLSEISFINIGQQLSERLLLLPEQNRGVYASDLFSEIIQSHESELIGLRRLEILFDKSLAIDPLKLLLQNSRDKTIVAVWPGYFDRKVGLTYAQPSHPEYKFYRYQDIKDLIIEI